MNLETLAAAVLILNNLRSFGAGAEVNEAYLAMMVCDSAPGQIYHDAVNYLLDIGAVKSTMNHFGDSFVPALRLA